MIASINIYTPLIQSLPVADQAFTVKASNWQKALSDFYFKEIFNDVAHICLSRRDLHDTNNIELFILKQYYGAIQKECKVKILRKSIAT